MGKNLLSNFITFVDWSVLLSYFKNTKPFVNPENLLIMAKTFKSIWMNACVYGNEWINRAHNPRVKALGPVSGA